LIGIPIGNMAAAPTIQITSIGIPDTMLLMLLALVVFGPRRLPEIGRQIGKLMYEFRKVSNDFKYQMEEELRAAEEAERQKKLAAAAALATSYPLQIETSQPETSQPETIYPPQPALQAPAPAVEEPAPAPELTPEAPRGEPRRFPNIQPPATGDPVEAAKPFRYRYPDTTAIEAVATEAAQESTPEPGASHV